jgi:hypothetical protein
MSTVIEIISEHLTKLGADGLVCPASECGCRMPKLAPCEDNIGLCQPGWSSPARDDPDDWLMWSSKEKADAYKAAQAGEGSAE